MRLVGACVEEVPVYVWQFWIEIRYYSTMATYKLTLLLETYRDFPYAVCRCDHHSLLVGYTHQSTEQFTEYTHRTIYTQ